MTSITGPNGERVGSTTCGRNHCERVSLAVGATGLLGLRPRRSCIRGGQHDAEWLHRTTDPGATGWRPTRSPALMTEVECDEDELVSDHNDNDDEQANDDDQGEDEQGDVEDDNGDAAPEAKPAKHHKHHSNARTKTTTSRPTTTTRARTRTRTKSRTTTTTTTRATRRTMADPRATTEATPEATTDPHPPTRQHRTARSLTGSFSSLSGPSPR